MHAAEHEQEHGEHGRQKADGSAAGGRARPRRHLRRAAATVSASYCSGDEDEEFNSSGDDEESSSTAKKARVAAKSSEGRVVQRWTAEEHAQLERLVEQFGGDRRWSKIAEHIPGRTGKQCRERWLNHLKPDIRRGGWTPSEEQVLCYWHSVLDSHWSKIVHKLPGRTENHIKNHWNSAYRSKSSAPRPGVLGTYVAHLRRGMDRHSAYANMLVHCGLPPDGLAAGGADGAGTAPHASWIEGGPHASSGPQFLAPPQLLPASAPPPVSLPPAGAVVPSAVGGPQQVASSDESSPAMVLVGAPVSLPATSLPPPSFSTHASLLQQQQQQQQQLLLQEGSVYSAMHAQQHTLVPPHGGAVGGGNGAAAAAATTGQVRAVLRQRAAYVLANIQRMAKATLDALQESPERDLLDPSHMGWQVMRAELAAVNAATVSAAGAAPSCPHPHYQQQRHQQQQQQHQQHQQQQLWREGSGVRLQPLPPSAALEAQQQQQQQQHHWEAASRGALPPQVPRPSSVLPDGGLTGAYSHTLPLFRSRSAPTQQLAHAVPPLFAAGQALHVLHDLQPHHSYGASLAEAAGGSGGPSSSLLVQPYPHSQPRQGFPREQQEQPQHPAEQHQHPAQAMHVRYHQHQAGAPNTNPAAVAAADPYFVDLLHGAEAQAVAHDFELLSPRTTAELSADLADWHG